MPTEERAIEVEVVEVDGVAVTQRAAAADDAARGRQAEWGDWRQWQGRVRQLDSRWWPLWAVLGVVVVFLVLTVGLVVAAVVLVVRLVLGILRGLAGMFR